MTPILSLLIQIFIDFLFIVGFILIWLKLKKNPEEDPRLSAGLQVLQNKIAVLEDLGDRTETQVQQLTTLLEKKLLEVQKKMEQAEGVLNRITQSMEKSLEVAKIFQDKIPHDEIIERQNTVKFVKAALLANQGKSTSEIAEEVDLSSGEIDFIVKVNKDELSFDEEQLPEWVISELKTSQVFMEKDIQFMESPLLKTPFTTPAGVSNSDQDALQQLGEKFRQAQFIIANHQSELRAREMLSPEKIIEIESENQSKELNAAEKAEVLMGKSQALTQPQNQSQSQIQSQSQSIASHSDIIKNLENSKNNEIPPEKKTTFQSAMKATPVEFSIHKEEYPAKNNNNPQIKGSSISQRAKELGIRPVVFPRLDKVDLQK